MKILKAGIMPRNEFQKYVLAIAAGRQKPEKEEPKIWFSSVRSLSEVLSDKNTYLDPCFCEGDEAEMRDRVDMA